MHRFLATFALVTLGSALLMSCRHGPQPPATPADPVARANYPHNVSLQGLSKVIIGAEPVVEPSTDQRPMRVTVPVRNLYSRELNVQYLFEFLDAKGRPIAGASGWHFKVLPSDMQIFLEGYAIDTTATDWRLTIRPAR